MISSVRRFEGTPYPLGSTKKGNGVNFAIFSDHATQVTLCLYNPSSGKKEEEIILDKEQNRTGNIWHILLENIPQSHEYAYKIDGPFDECKGHLFAKEKILSDPSCKSLSWSKKWGEEKKYPLKSKIIFDEFFDWQNISSPNYPLQDLIIYEMHIRGFTKDPTSKVHHPGTFTGIIEKIPYLKELGINAVELLPVFEFNECAHPKNNKGLHNYWGYSPINFFSLMNRYTSEEEKSAIIQFKTLIRELHRNGLEVILDVVYNHTAEGADKSAYFNFRGIENSVYYLLDEKGNYLNYSGCGNTFNCNHIVCREHILHSLRYWVSEMKVDGFRFDLASILTRDTKGHPMDYPPLIEAISLDPIFADTKLIAEAWDCAGLYQVGSFPSWGKWMEWNGKFRDTTRNFLKGEIHQQGNFAMHFLGSSQLYGDIRTPCHSINFITAHDGFSLMDLVSYNRKHNEMNGEENKDGINENFSWNCGHEGPSTDPKIQHLRIKQIKNFFLTLLTAQGTPMIQMGDEYAHTKNGNNNTWCHDNELNWFQWDKLHDNQEIFRFVKCLIQFRKDHPSLGRKKFLKDEDVEWHSTTPLKATWDNPNGLLALTLKISSPNFLYFAFNPTATEVLFTLPKYHEDCHWVRRVDTSLPYPEDFSEDSSTKVEGSYLANSYSSIVLEWIEK